MPHRKSHKRSRKGRKTMKKRGGASYGFNGAVGTGAPSYGITPEVTTPEYARGGRRSKSRRSTRRRVKGGTRFETASAGYVGTGSRGVADYVDVGSTRGTSAMGSFNNHGSQPGSGGSSFIKVN